MPTWSSTRPTGGAYDTWLGLSGPPLPPSPLLAPGDPPATTVVFDCVGAPGLLAQHIEFVPSHSRLVIVGVCAVPDTFVPVRAIEKELTIRFVFAYRPAEFAHRATADRRRRRRRDAVDHRDL